MFALLENKKASMFVSMCIHIHDVPWCDTAKNTRHKREKQTYNEQMQNGNPVINTHVTTFRTTTTTLKQFFNG